MENILVIITASIAAYKSLDLISRLRKSGHHVTAVLTKSAQQFVTPLSAAAISGNECLTSDTWKMEHISLARRSDKIIICPASADFISRLACGLGGELALDIMLAKLLEVPVFICPAMNHAMWDNAIIKENVEKLQNIGYNFIMPAAGELACGESGIGRLEEPENIIKQIFYRPLTGKKIVITAGGTIEKIDDVRYISNFSSGIQGIEIAKKLANLGAHVSLVYGNIKANLPSHPNIANIHAESARDMLDKVLRELKADVFIAAAAVADFYVANAKTGKIKKDKMPQIELEKNPDILHTVATHKKRPELVIGFCLESEKILENAKIKLAKKNCDFIYGNGSNFGATLTNGYLLGKDGSCLEFSGNKVDFASILADKIINTLKI